MVDDDIEFELVSLLLGDVVLTYFPVLDFGSFKKLHTGRSDYGFHSYGELCHFVYCILGKTRDLLCLPSIHDWEAYMEVELVNEFPAVSDDDYLANYELGERLRGSSGSEIREFGVKSRQFLDSLVTHLLSLVFASSSVSQGLYCFCPELLLEGDDVAVLELFGKLLKVFSDSGLLTSVEVAEAREEFTTFVVEIRLSHKSSKQRAEDIPDIISYLSKSYILLQRRSLLRVFQLCCLVVDMPLREMPDVDIDLSDCRLRPLLLTSCLRSVQSYVLSKSYQQKSLFTSQTLDAVREAIRNSTNFLQGGFFDPWSGRCQRE